MPKLGWSAQRILEGYGEHLRRTPEYTRPKRLIKTGVDVQDMNRQCFEFVESLGFADSQLMRIVYGSNKAIPEEWRESVQSFEADLADFLKENPWEPKDRREDRGYIPVEALPLPQMARKHNIESRELRRWCDAGMPHFKSGKKLLYVQESVVVKWKNREYRHKKVKSIKRNRQKQSKICPESARSAA